MNKKIAVIGRIAEGTVLIDGQTVKTKILYEELRKEFPETEVVCVDLYEYKRKILLILWRIIKVFIQCEHIFVLVSRNGRKFLFPIMNRINFLFRRNIYHDVIGGALSKEVRENISLRKQLNKFKVNWVEFSKMKEELENAGVCNVEVLPNFKRLNILPEEKIEDKNEGPFVFVMFSRVMKEKGMETAARAVAEVNRELGKQQAVLHIYGPVEAEYRTDFDLLLKEFADCVEYKGCVSFNESVEALGNGYMLLFPSVYPGEGMPGTIIDAFSAGLPVIASDWRFNSELVKQGRTGFCYNWRNPGELAEYIRYSVETPQDINKMRKNCLKEAVKYTPEMAMKKIRQKMQECSGGEIG